jgi:2-iminobutanoate/2-iminopropanoate deaminase
VEGGIEEQTERVLRNLTAVLEEAGTSWARVVKTTVYLQDLSHFPTVNEIYGRVIGDARPARSTVQVSALPRAALVEIDAVAVVG